MPNFYYKDGSHTSTCNLGFASDGDILLLTLKGVEWYEQPGRFSKEQFLYKEQEMQIHDWEKLYEGLIRGSTGKKLTQQAKMNKLLM